MGRKILLNGKIVDAALKLEPTSPALNYGKGLFETLLYEKGKLYFFESHIRRLEESCTALNLDFDLKTLSQDRILKLIHRNGDRHNCLRVKILYLNLKNIWESVVYTAPYERLTEHLTICSHSERRQRQFTRHKTTNYFENLYWKDFYARRYHADEVLFRNYYGNYIEGSYTNIFCVKDGVLYYPSGENDFLQGIMHRKIIKNYRALGFSGISAKRNGLRENLIKSCDEVILTNSLFLARSAGMFYDTSHNHTYKFMQRIWSRKIREYFLS